MAARKLKDQLTCAICLEQYKDPRSLSCLHSFCTGCLERLPREDGTVWCPSCRTTTRLPQGKITALPVAFHVNNLLEVQNLLQKSSGSNAICSNCPQEKAKFYCPDCDKFLCRSCNDFHGRWSSFSTHKVMGIEEVANKATKMVSVKPIPPMECPKHNKPLEVYCMKCDQPICYLCTIKDHKGHDHTLVSDVYEECKQKIREKIKLLEEKVQQIKKVNKVQEKSKNDVQEKAEVHKTKINRLCDDFVEEIEKVRRLGLQAVEGGTASYIACKYQQIKKEEAAIQALNDCKQYVEYSLKKSTPPQLMLMKKQIMERFEKLAVPEPVVKTYKVAKHRHAFGLYSNELQDMYANRINHKYRNQSQIPQCPQSQLGISQCPQSQIPRYRPQSQIPQYPQSQIPQYPQSQIPQYPQSQIPQFPHSLPNQQDSNELTIKDLKKNIFLFVPLQYPQLAYEQCELVADFPEDIIQGNFLYTGTFALLFKGHPMIVDTKEVSCFLKLEIIFRNNSTLRTEKQEEYPCDVDYSHDDIKYQVSFTPQNAGTYSFHVKIGSTTVSSKIKIEVQNSRLQSYEAMYN